MNKTPLALKLAENIGMLLRKIDDYYDSLESQDIKGSNDASLGKTIAPTCQTDTNVVGRSSEGKTITGMSESQNPLNPASNASSLKRFQKKDMQARSNPAIRGKCRAHG